MNGKEKKERPYQNIPTVPEEGRLDLAATLREKMAAHRSPDLKSNENMMQLAEELSSTENKIAFARQAYNDAVMRYNNKCEMVPSNIVANMFGFQRAEFFEVEDEAQREPVEVQF